MRLFLSSGQQPAFVSESSGETVPNRLYYLAPPVQTCYTQLTPLIPSLIATIGQNYKREPPLCVCESYSEFSELPKRILELTMREVDSTRCEYKQQNISSILEECHSYKEKSCMAHLWFQDQLGLPPDYLIPKEDLPASVKNKGVLLGCGLDKIDETSTVAVKIDEIGAFGIGHRCNREKIVALLNEKKIERYRKGSSYYYRILIDPLTDFSGFCDPQLSKEGSSVQIFYSCSAKTPDPPVAVQNCISECQSIYSSCAQDPKCSECSPENDLHITAQSMKECFEKSGYYIFASGVNICKKNVDPGSWAVNFDLYDMLDLGNSEGDYVDETPIYDTISYMGAYIGNGYILTINAATHGGYAVAHLSVSTDLRENPDYTTIASGGTNNINENLKDSRYMSFQTSPVYRSPNLDLSLVKLRRKIANLKPLCMPSADMAMPEIHLLKTFGWSNSDDNDHLKEPKFTDFSDTTRRGHTCKRFSFICMKVDKNQDLLCDMDSGTALAAKVEAGADNIWYLLGIFEGKRNLPFTPCEDDVETKNFIDMRKFEKHVCDQAVSVCTYYYFIHDL